MEAVGSVTIRSFETIRLSRGADQLHAESMAPHVFSVEESQTFLGRVYDHWLASGEPTDTSFLLPSDIQFRPRRIASRDEKRMILPVALDEDGLPSSSLLNEETVIGLRHPFGSFTLACLNDCRLRRQPVYLHMSIQRADIELDFTRLFLPSVDDRDRISRIDVVHRFIGDRRPRRIGEAMQ